MDYQRLIDAAVASARNHRNACETHLQGGGSTADETYQDNYRAAENALAEADGLRTAQEQAERLARINTDPLIDDTPRGTETERNVSDAERQYVAYVNRYREDRPWAEFERVERNQLQIVSDPDGGFTVPADRQGGILRQIPARSTLLSLISNPPTSRDRVTWLRVQPNPDSPDIFTSAFVGSMVPEIGGGPDTQPKFGTFQIDINKARASARFSMDLASDSEIDMTSFLSEDGSTNLALLKEQQVLVGSGVGNNLRGVMNTPGILTKNVGGTTTNTISNTDSAIGSAPKLLDLLYAVPAQYRANPSFRFVMNPQTELAIRKLVDGDNRFIWVPGFNGEPNTLLNHGIVHSEFMEDNATPDAANKLILAGPLSEIIAPQRSSVSVQVLLERYADEDLLGIVLRWRFGVGVPNVRAFRIGLASSS